MFSSGLRAWFIRGVIRDISFRSVENVSIIVRETGKTFYSLKDGYFEISIPDNLHNITLEFESKLHYEKSVKIRFTKKLKPLTVILIQKEYIKDEITVTAFDIKEQSLSSPKVQTLISELELKEKISDTLVDTLADSPGVHFIGSGGFMTTPSIRGLARRRVLLLVDGVRITGDRRAGNSGVFLSPELINQIEIVRSSSSVIYGSDAVGGVIQLITDYESDKIDSGRSVNLALNNISSRISSGFSFVHKSENLLINSGLQYSSAGNYSSPTGEIYNSGYKNISGIFGVKFSKENREFSLKFIGGSGTDIGKPDRDNDPFTFTTVRKNSNHFFIFKYNDRGLIKNGNIKLTAFVNPTVYILDKGNTNDLTLKSSDTSAYNSGLSLRFSKSPREKIGINSGIDIYLRNDLDIVNSDENGIEFPLKDGNRRDIAAFISGTISEIMGVEVRGGIRYTFSQTKAISDGVLGIKKTDSPSIFLGLVKNLGKSVSLFFNSGTSFRNPSLTESFYSGMTGRKFVIGNADLKPEKSFNMDGGVKIFTGNTFLGLYFFSNYISNMIERFRNTEGIYSYANIDSGKISGGEAELQWFPGKNSEIFGHFNYYFGRNLNTNFPLNDIPSPKLFLGGKINVGKSWFEVNFLHSFKKNDPGPAEIENGQYNLVTLKSGYYFSSRFFMYCKISNLLNERFYPNPDPDIPENEKISFSLSLNYFF